MTDDALAFDGAIRLVDGLSLQLAAARYVFHKVTVHKYALAVWQGQMTTDVAREHYHEAMRNYDSIVERAVNGNAAEANAIEMDKGADAVTEAVEELHKRMPHE